jgi:general stress protein 26
MTTYAFHEIEAEFNKRVQQMIWCNVATVDEQERPRSRVMHPVWENMTGWVTSRRNAYKGKHLSLNPHVSLAYVADVAKPVYIDCVAEWEDRMDEKIRVWEFLKSTPPPYGFDPATIFQTIDNPNYGLLRLTPWRIELVNIPQTSFIWRRT